MGKDGLRAGVARLDITPPVPIDLVGYSRRWMPATEIRYPLTSTAMVLDDGDTRIVIVALDLLALRHRQAEDFRARVATAVSTVPERVMINVSHTHAGPQAHLDGLKIGGDQRGHSANERAFIEYLPTVVAATARLAAERLEPARVGAGIGAVDLAVNRRERAPDGRTILGWNPDGLWDRDVAVLRVDKSDGSPLATIVNFACHPVVIGPDDPGISPDYPAPMRQLVEDHTRAPCLFIQGAGGNVLPLEGFFAEPGPEVAFGRRLAVEAIHVLADIETHPASIERLDFGSVTPISLYRRVREVAPAPQPLHDASVLVELPLKRVPKKVELEEALAGYQADLAQATTAGADRARLNPLEYHVNWAEAALQLLRAGEVSPSTPAFLQAFRIGEAALVGVPGEVFSEIALQVKQRSPAAITLFAGYSNGVISYLPTAAEYPFGGYEVDYAHHSFGLIEQVAPESEAILVEGCVDLLEQLW